MRKIEKEMLEALQKRVLWHKDNTAVLLDKDGITLSVYLYGNPIAKVTNIPALNVFEVEPNIATLLAHPTVTTCSRLRALGVNVSLKKGIPHINATPAAL